MTINGIGPDTFDHLELPHAKKAKTKQEKAALKVLADISEGTSTDSTLNESEIKSTKGWGIYSFISTAAAKVLGFGASFVLPDSAMYDTKISSLEDELYTMTGASYAADLAQTIGLHQLNKIQYFLEHPEKLTPKSAESGVLKNLVSVSGHSVTISPKGKIVLELLQTPSTRELFEKTFYVNLLKALKNVTAKAQEQKPDFAIRLLQDIMVDVKQALVTESDQASNKEHDTFMTKLNHDIVHLLFPNGEADIELPLPFERFFSKKAFITLQEKQLPRKMDIYYEKATSESLKYKLLSAAANQLKAILQKELPEKKEPVKKKSLPQYKDQKQFNNQLKEVVSSLIDYIDDPSLKLLKGSILKKVEKLGPEITGKLLSLDVTDILNKRFAAACTIFSHDGYWEPVGDKERFHYVAHIPTTKEERAKIDEAQRVEKKREFEETLREIAAELEKEILRRTKVPSETRAKNIKEGLEIVQKKITHGLIRFALKLFRADKRISRLSERVIQLSENLSLKSALKPVKRSISRKI